MYLTSAEDWRCGRDGAAGGRRKVRRREARPLSVEAPCAGLLLPPVRSLARSRCREIRKHLTSDTTQRNDSCLVCISQCSNVAGCVVLPSGEA